MQGLEPAPQTRITIVDLLATIEHRLRMGRTEQIQVSAMVPGIKASVAPGKIVDTCTSERKPNSFRKINFVEPPNLCRICKWDSRGKEAQEMQE
jgi:hypothetical protein